MNKKLTVLFGVLILLVGVLSACNRPASESPTAVPTSGLPFPVSPTQGVSQFATQTAAAKLPVVVTATKPAGEVKTPAPGSTADPSGSQPTAKPTDKPITVPTLTRPSTYTIQPGEFLICIARRYNLDLAEFLALNGLSMSSQVSIGDVLNIPVGGTWSLNYGSRYLAVHPDTYIVKDGDTIGKIACLYGDVSPEAILAVNNLKSSSDLWPGQSLQIP